MQHIKPMTSSCRIGSTAEQRSASPKKPEDDTGGGEAKGLVELHTHHNSCPRGEHCACYVTGYTDAEYDHGHVFESLDDKLTVVEKKTLSHRPTPATATTYNLKIVALAKAYCDAHIEDYETMKNSDSMDVDADFMLLFQAVNDCGDDMALNDCIAMIKYRKEAKP